MAAELVRGQNHVLTQTRLEIRVSAGEPVAVGAALTDDQGRLSGPDLLAHPGSPTLPGLEVSQQAAADHRLAVDLGAMKDDVHRVAVLLALPQGTGGPTCFRDTAAPFVAVTGLDGVEIASYTIIGLESESAVIAVELYRRQGAWKVRAVGQGYAGGLVDLLADMKLPDAAGVAATVHDAVLRGLARSVATPPLRSPHDTRTRGVQPQATTASPAPAPEAEPAAAATASAAGKGVQTDPGAGGGATPSTQGRVDYTHPDRGGTTAPPPAAPSAPPEGPPTPVAGDATGWTMEERLYNQVWGMFEDLARSTAAYRSAVDFADSRRERELDKVLSDPRSRMGKEGDAARRAAAQRYEALVAQAREAFDRDLGQLRAESEVVEPALPVAFARWDSPVWHAYEVPTEPPMALRLGDLHLPESPDLRIPMLVRLPLERGLWIDSGRSHLESAVLVDDGELRRLALQTATALATRLLAVHPVGTFVLHVIDAAGAGADGLGPLLRSGALDAPPAAGAKGVADLLAQLTRRVDLVQMAARSGAADALPPDVDTAQHLLVVHDFPHGFDDRAVNQLRYLADEGPAVGVHLMLVGSRKDAASYGPLLDPLWRSLLRLPPLPDDHLADPWVGHTWTYEPLLVPPGSEVLHQVLARVASARHPFDH